MVCVFLTAPHTTYSLVNLLSATRTAYPPLCCADKGYPSPRCSGTGGIRTLTQKLYSLVFARRFAVPSGRITRRPGSAYRTRIHAPHGSGRLSRRSWLAHSWLQRQPITNSCFSVFRHDAEGDSGPIVHTGLSHFRAVSPRGMGGRAGVEPAVSQSRSGIRAASGVVIFSYHIGTPITSCHPHIVLLTCSVLKKTRALWEVLTF
jgi:hypothetical protein